MTGVSELTHPSVPDSTTPLSASPILDYTRALNLAATEHYESAIKVLRDVTARAPGHGPAWQKLSELLYLAGKDEESSSANARAAGLTAEFDPLTDDRDSAKIEADEQVLREHLSALATAGEQQNKLRSHLREHPADAVALRALGRLERDRGHVPTARNLFERALELATYYVGAREDLVLVLRVLQDDAHALAETRLLIAQSPESVNYRALLAAGLFEVGDMEAAIPVLEQLIREDSSRVRIRGLYAQTLYYAGRRHDSARECRALLEMRPGMGAAYSRLAEMRDDFLGPADVTAMREHLREPGEDKPNSALIQFALGLVLEQTGDFSGSFAAYEAGTALAREIAADKSGPYDVATDVDKMRRRCAVFTRKTLSKCAVPQPAAAAITPIFIVGMPRAGSTLVEQILGSHSLVEATLELPVLNKIAGDLSRSRALVTPDAYPECMTSLSEERLAELGARFIRDAAAYRKTDRPYFVDKCPWNWFEAGLIRMILPQARIVDIRREPMAACFGMYKQNLADAGAFSNDFNDLATYYTEYVRTMDHYDTAMPGHIYCLSYERLVEDTENQIRRLLDYCGLPFEENCLRFWETQRPVSTPSAEQVRRPIFRDAVQQWRRFEPWLGPLKEALRKAETAAAAAPQPAGYDFALTFAAMSVCDPAMKKLRAVTRREPTHAGAWSKLAELLRLSGKDKAADDAAAAAARHAGEASNWQKTRDLRTAPQLEAAKEAFETELKGKERGKQMNWLRNHLAENPTDTAAIFLLSDLEFEDRDELTSLALLERALELAPAYHAARYQFARRLADGQFVRALEHTSFLVRRVPQNPIYRELHAEQLRQIGRFSEAIALTDELLREFPRHPRFRFRYGLLLRSLGRRDESARAFRACLQIAPAMGEAYAGLADLKDNLLTDDDVTAIRGHMADPSLPPHDRMNMYYALGSALERRGDFSASFKAYQAAARLFRGAFLGMGEAHNEEETVGRIRGLKNFYTQRFLSPSPAAPTNRDVTPIFVVGMPRAGSTLVEHILGSHSQVEATSELPLIGQIVRDIAISRRLVMGTAYPERLSDMTPDELAALGNLYIERARDFRKTDWPYFVDKRPWNWIDAGLIHLILPHSKIIDIRREPMAACFANFKQKLPKDAEFSNDLAELGHYYNLYVSLMDHWKEVMPGRIHFVQYERLVQNTENEIRRMLEYCGLPFEEGCLRFWESDRAVTTPSAEQVRRPIYLDAVEQWRNFEPWLGPLKAALSEPARA
ncbi:MAG TPA: sulfotransferase [Rhizomicrobium sp.]|jgi:predicted Zn-dependent protease|nr:sulfotransferase [Rhizomicrobium sp.]